MMEVVNMLELRYESKIRNVQERKVKRVIGRLAKDRKRMERTEYLEAEKGKRERKKRKEKKKKKKKARMG
jgi:hypothetical protein